MKKTVQIEELSSRYQVRRLTAEDAPEILALCAGNRLFYQYEAPTPTLESVLRDMTLLPPGKSLEDKHYLGCYDEAGLAAVMDLIDGYPDAETAYLGLFMMEASRQGQGAGTSLLEELCSALPRFGFRELRLCYRKANPQASHFWLKNGLRPLRELTREDGGIIVEASRPLFRPVARKKQALTREDCLALLRQEKRGVLSVLGDGGYPYGVPINHWYNPADGKLYFHSGPVGHKIDAMRRDCQASFCVIDAGEPEPGGWALNFKSVIVFGRLEIVGDHAKALEISRQISYKFTRDEEYIEEEIRRSGAKVLCFALTPEHMTGKRINEK